MKKFAKEFSVWTPRACADSDAHPSLAALYLLLSSELSCKSALYSQSLPFHKSFFHHSKVEI